MESPNPKRGSRQRLAGVLGNKTGPHSLESGWIACTRGKNTLSIAIPLLLLETAKVLSGYPSDRTGEIHSSIERTAAQ